MNIEVKIFNNILAKWIWQYIKRIIHHNQVRFTPGIKDGSTSKIYVIHHTNKIKGKNMIISMQKKLLIKFKIHLP